MSGGRIMASVFLGLACVLTLAVPAAMQADSLGDPGPVLLPRIVGICMAVLAVVLLLTKPQEQHALAGNTERPLIISLSLLAIPVFYLMFQYLGYTLAVGLYLLAAFYLLGLHNRKAFFRYVLAAAAFSLVSGMVFARMLGLPLPGVLP